MTSFEDKTLTEDESLRLITTMINNARNRFTEDGALYILWGWLVLFCCLVHFTGLYFFHYVWSFYIWLLTWVMAIAQLFFIKKRIRQRRYNNFSDGLRGAIWLAFTVCTILMTALLVVEKAYYAINPAIMVMYGMPALLTGVLLKFKPLKIGAIGCWLLAIAGIIVPFEFQLILVGLAVVIAWLIPGYLLRARYSVHFPVRKLAVV